MARLRAYRIERRRLVVLAVALLVTLTFGAGKRVLGNRQEAGYFFDVRSIDTADLGVEAPAGLAYSEPAQALFVLGRSRQGDALVAMNLDEEVIAASTLPVPVASGPTMAFDEQSGAIWFLDQAGKELIAMAAPPGESATSFDAGRLALQEPQAIAFDSRRGDLYILEGQARVIVRLARPAGRSLEEATAAGDVERLSLDALPAAPLHALALHPDSGHLFVLDAANYLLYELDNAGVLLATRDLSSLRLDTPRAMVFAPSGDSTDDPQQMSLYLADAGDATNTGQIVELLLDPPALRPNLPAQTTAAFLVQTIDTSLWSPASPDPSGIDYNPGTGQFVIADGEVEEMNWLYEDVNVYQMNPAGDLLATCDTTHFSTEPVGVAVNPANGHIFFSNDSRKVVHEVNPGADGIYCTGDDTLTSFSTNTFGSNDPEGLAYGDGRLFISDGGGAEIYVISPGPNGRFDGIDDSVTHWDVDDVGLRDPEGIAYHPGTGTLFVASRNVNFIAEMTTDGDVLALIDVSFLNTSRLSGAAIGPGSVNPAVMSVYLTDRGVDNNDDPDENDGKIYEVDLGREAPPPTPTATNTPTVTPTATTGPSPTPDGTPTPTATPGPCPAGTNPLECQPSLPNRFYLPSLRR